MFKFKQSLLISLSLWVQGSIHLNFSYLLRLASASMGENRLTYVTPLGNGICAFYSEFSQTLLCCDWSGP